jgi:hypothetical protein
MSVTVYNVKFPLVSALHRKARSVSNIRKDVSRYKPEMSPKVPEKLLILHDSFGLGCGTVLPQRDVQSESIRYPQGQL